MSDKAIFLDRDDTLIEDPGYISDPDQVKLLDGAAEALIELKALGYKLIVVTNQSAVARGIVTEKVLGEIHDRLKQLLAQRDVVLDSIYYCPYHPDGVVPKYRKESNCRKPSPGMLLKAADEMDIDLGQSWCIGNSSLDVEAGLRAGCKTILIDMPSHQKQPSSSISLAGVTPDHKAVNIKEAVNIIKKYLRSSVDDQAQTRSIATDQTESASQAPEQVVEVAKPTSRTEEQQMQSELQEPQPPEQEIPAGTTEQLLNSILGQLRSMQRADMFAEFSVMRLMAGVVQILVLFCLLITVWLLMSPNRQDSSVFTALGFAIILQLMALTFYTMQGRK
ncbi:MAG: D-glycero-alpha-D-manno-heptose-1,7-bisphosphate 7-phosphatase [Planctomycetota bacterium]|jgi:D,D-heptose 1,7-bisphosphate phosphatase